MKVMKSICLDEDLINSLSKVNASELINRLLSEHFQGTDNKNIVKLKQKLAKNVDKMKKIRKEIKETREIIEEIERKERLTLAIAKKIPTNLLKSMDDYTTWIAFATSFRSELSKLGLYADAKQVFYELKGGKQK